MAVKYIENREGRPLRRFIGLSTDVKPSGSDIPVGSRFDESDSGFLYKWDESTWVLIPQPEPIFVWKDQRFEYSAGMLIYDGFNVIHKAATSTTTWYISKYTWVRGDMVRREGPLIGAWSGRTSLAWA